MSNKLNKDPKHDGKADPEIIWVDKFESYLPKDIELDELAARVKSLIALVKEDHARFQYNKEIKHYSRIIVDILDFARKNGYNVTEVKRRTIDEVEDSKWDDIIDG